MLIVIIVVSF